MAWTDHAAAMEEGVAARDDLRTSLGQPYVLRRCTELAGEVHQRFASVVRIEAGIGRRTGMLLHGVLAATALVGVVAGRRRPAVDRLAGDAVPRHHDVRRPGRPARPTPARSPGRLRRGDPAARAAGLRAGAGGRRWPCPTDRSSVRFADLHFAYADGTFALSGVDLAVPAGTTCALVGRTGSGKSTLASLLSRAVEPERGLAAPRRRRRPRPRPPAAPRGGRRRHPAHRDPGRHARREHHALRRRSRARPSRPRSTSSASTAWVAGLPRGLDTLLGPGGTSLSAGEEQLVAFARLLVRDVRVVVLDEATARMDPLTEARVVARRRPAARRVAPACWSPTGSRRPSAPSRSPSSTAAASSSTGPRDELAAPRRPVPRPARRRRPASRLCDRCDAGRHDRRGRHPTPYGSAAAGAGAATRSPAWPARPRTRCSSSRSGAWSAWRCSWSAPSPARSARSPAGCGATSSPASSRASTPYALTALLVVSLHRVARCCWRSRSGATRSGGSR